MREDRNIGVSKIIHDFINRDYDRTNGPNYIWDFYNFNEVKDIIYKYVEVVTAKAILYGNKNRLLDFNVCEHPLVLQLGGSEPKEIAKIA